MISIRNTVWNDLYYDYPVKYGLYEKCIKSLVTALAFELIQCIISIRNA